MTNTLHRYSEHYAFEPPPTPQPVDNDFIVFAMASRAINDEQLVEKYRLLSLAQRADLAKIRAHDP